MRNILTTGEEANEGAALASHVVAHGAAQHGKLHLERIENGALSDGAFHIQLYIAIYVREGAEMRWERDADPL